MTKRDKRLQKLRQNPKQVTFDELKHVLQDHGFKHVRTSGSHHTFIVKVENLDLRITIPFHRPIKFPYVREALEMIDRIREIQKESDEEDVDE